MAAAPTMIIATTAITLTSENQNSVSANTREENALRPKSAAAKMSDHTHTGTSGNQRCMRIPEAVNSLPRATAQHSQYSQATAKPQAGPR